MSVTAGIKRAHPDCEIHWITRKDMSGMLKTDPDIDRLWEFDRSLGMKGLIKMAKEIKKIQPDIIYDAHLNIRSFVLKLILSPVLKRWFKLSPPCVVRSKNRVRRMLFFNFNIRNAIKFPFKGILSFQEPLKKVGWFEQTYIQKNYKFTPQVVEKVSGIFKEFNLHPGEFITLIPSAAWELKRWPVSHWKELVNMMPNAKFLILAGPEDSFTKEIEEVAPDRVVNLAGRTNLLESFYVISVSHLVVSADTGFLHAADLFRKNAIAFMGPTAFGHPTNEMVKVMEVDLPCRPCTKEGNATCKLSEHKKCLMDIKPLQVIHEINRLEQTGSVS